MRGKLLYALLAFLPALAWPALRLLILTDDARHATPLGALLLGGLLFMCGITAWWVVILYRFVRRRGGSLFFGTGVALAGVLAAHGVFALVSGAWFWDWAAIEAAAVVLCAAICWAIGRAGGHRPPLR